MTAEKLLGGGPAGRPTHAGGPQPEGVLILSERDERVVAWLVDLVGDQAVACSRLAGRRRAYPSNLAKVLAIDLPKLLELTPSDRALEKIAELRRFGWQRQEHAR